MGNPRGMRRDFEALEKRRMAAVRLFPTDLNNSEIGRRLKICDQTVSRWRAQYRAGGESALRKAGRAGRKPLLSTADPRRSLQNRPLMITSKPASGPHPGQEDVVPRRPLFRQVLFLLDAAGDRARGISAKRFEIPLAGGGAYFAPWGEPS